MSVLEYIKQEFAVIKAAPVSCLFIASIGFGLAMLWQGERMDLLRAQNETYKRDQGISGAYSGVYADLSNDDLKSKTAHMVRQLRDLQFEFQHKLDYLNGQVKDNKVPADRTDDIFKAYAEETSERFIKNYRAEAINLNQELRHRLSAQAVQVVISSGPVLDSSLSPLNFVSGQFSAMGLERAANELEELNGKLPPDKHGWWLYPSILITISLSALLVFWAIHSGVRIVRIRDSQVQPPSPE